jgi:ATP-dependent DNA helicase RecG
MRRLTVRLFYGIVPTSGLHDSGITMTEETLRQRTAGGETGTIEFKIKAPRPAELAERMCGMANTRSGGTIIFGVADKGNVVVGLKEPQQTIDLALRAARLVKPPIPFVGSGPTTHLVDGATLVVAEIPPNAGTLYQSSGVFWMRKGSHTVPTAADEIAAHLHSSGAIRWQRGAHPHPSLDAIDRERVEQYLALRDGRRIDLRHTAWEDLLIGMECAVRDAAGDVGRRTSAC